MLDHVTLCARADAVIAEIRSRRDFDWAPEMLVRDLAAARLELTSNERAALVAVSHGHSKEDIAAMLGISVEAVKGRLKHVRKKMGARTTGHAACEAIRQGLIP